MRILQVHNRHSTRGGADEVMDAEAGLLRGAGHEVNQYTQASGAQSGGNSAINAVNAVWNRTACREISQVMDQFSPDIVHVHTPFPLLSPAVFRVVSRHHTPAVTTVHSYRYSCIAGTCLRDSQLCEDCVGRTWKSPGIRHKCYHGSYAASSALTVSLGAHRMLGTFDRKVSRYITLTEFARQLLIRDGMAPDRVVVKPNSVPDPGNPVRRTGEASYALFAGRLVEEKGVRTLLEAWREVGDRLRLVIAGDGPLRPLVDEAARSNPNIVVLGWLDAQELQSRMACAELVVVPSEWYEEPLTLLQALAAGRPVIASDLENTSETVVAARAGLTFRVGDPRSLASTVLDGVDGLGSLRDMGERGRAAYEERFTPEVMVDSLQKIYRSAISEYS